MDTLLNAEEREFAQQMRQFYRTEDRKSVV